MLLPDGTGLLARPPEARSASRLRPPGVLSKGLSGVGTAVAVGLLLVGAAAHSAADSERRAESQRAVQAGMEQAGQNRYAEAIRLLEEAVLAWPENGEAFYHLGLVYEAAGAHAGAGFALDRAATLLPDAVHVHHARGAFHLRHGIMDAATEAYERLTALAPYDGVARAQLGNLYQRQGRVADAIRHLEAAVNVTHPDDRPLLAQRLYHLGLAYRERVRQTRAAERAAFEAALRADATYASAHLAIGVLDYNDALDATGAERRRLLESAREHLRSAAAHADRPHGLVSLDEVRALIQRVDEALRTLAASHG